MRTTSHYVNRMNAAELMFLVLSKNRQKIHTVVAYSCVLHIKINIFLEKILDDLVKDIDVFLSILVVSLCRKGVQYML